MYNVNTMGSKSGYYNPLPLIIALSSVLCKIEQKLTCHSHGILQLPRSLIWTVVLPLHLYLSNGSVPDHCDLIEDVQWLGLELSLGFHLDHILINHMVRIMNIFLKQRNMKKTYEP